MESGIKDLPETTKEQMVENILDLLVELAVKNELKKNK